MNIDALHDHVFVATTQTIAPRDVILYALSAGWGSDPEDMAELRYVYEDGLLAAPSCCQVMAVPPFWPRDSKFGVDWRRIVHAEQSFTTFGPLPVTGDVHSLYRVDAVVDRGTERGALVQATRDLYVGKADDPIATIRSSWLLRGDGGCGSFGTPHEKLQPVPDLPMVESLVPTQSSAALLYRLNGDLNPLHADPAAAQAAGFVRPILHGLGTMAMVQHILVRLHGLYDVTRMTMSTRFSGIFYPGETLHVDSTSGPAIRFGARSVDRDASVLDLGELRYERD